jgi:hypothetical protein
VRVLVLALLLGSPALADDVPDNACNRGLTVGASCVTDDGTAGTCVSVGGELICQPLVGGAQREALPWLGAGLAFLALCFGISTRRPGVQSGA